MAGDTPSRAGERRLAYRRKAKRPRLRAPPRSGYLNLPSLPLLARSHLQTNTRYAVERGTGNCTRHNLGLTRVALRGAVNKRRTADGSLAVAP